MTEVLEHSDEDRDFKPAVDVADLVDGEQLTPSRPEVQEDPQSLVELLDMTGVEHMTSEQRLAYIEQSTLNDYIVATIALHKILAPDADPNRTEKHMGLSSKVDDSRQMAARPDERYDVMEKAFTNAQAVVAKYRAEGGSIQNVLERCANLAAFGITFAHMFDDGSGRTARTMAEVVRNGHGPEQADDLKAVSANRPTTGFRINSYVPKSPEANLRADAFLDLVAGLDVPLDTEQYRSKVVRGNFTTPYES